jgi:transcriptional regulator with XRE-family HTH domain
MRDLRNALTEARGARVTQAVFARALGVSASLINAIESSQARGVSEDLHDRIALRFGVRLNDPVARRTICMAFPDLPLAEGLRKWDEQHRQVEAGALFAFDLDMADRIRAWLLAAYRKGKAAIFLDVMHRELEELSKEMGLTEAAVLQAGEEVYDRGGFPAEIFADNADALETYAQAFLLSRGLSAGGGEEESGKKAKRAKGKGRK